MVLLVKTHTVREDPYSSLRTTNLLPTEGFNRRDAFYLIVKSDIVIQGNTYSGNSATSDMDYLTLCNYWSGIAVDRGIVVQADDYRYGDTLTRAEAAALVNRMVGNTSRIDNSVNAITYNAGVRPNYESYEHTFHDYKNTTININTPLTDRDIMYTSKYASDKSIFKYVWPQVGDDINGITITKDPYTGILAFGEGQTGGIWNDGLSKISINSVNNYMTLQGKVITSNTGFQYDEYEWNVICDFATDYLFSNYTDVTMLSDNYVYMDIYGNKVDDLDDTTLFYSIDQDRTGVITTLDYQQLKH